MPILLKMRWCSICFTASALGVAERLVDISGQRGMFTQQIFANDHRVHDGEDAGSAIIFLFIPGDSRERAG